MARTKGARVTLVAPAAADGDAFTVTKNGLRYAGTHLLMELWGTTGAGDPALVERVLCEAAAACGATVLHLHVERLEGGGVTGIAALSESHISLHAWPERGYVAVDVFLCGALDPYAAVAPLRRALRPEWVQLSEFRRGIVT